MILNDLKKRIFPVFLLLCVVFSQTSFYYKVMAGTITTMSDTMSRLKTSTASDHDIRFVMPAGVPDGEYMTLTFASGFNMNSVDYQDMDLRVSASSSCSAFPDSAVLGSSPSGTTWGASLSGQVITFESGTEVIPAGRCIQVRIGLNATDDATGDTQIINPSSTGSYDIDLFGSENDVGTFSVAIADNDQVTVSAVVSSVLTFDIDTASGGGNGESSTPYAVDFGTITTSDTRVSGATDGVQMIVLEADTNASGGVTVTVKNANGASGMVSTSTPADSIASADGTIADGTENYGLCVATSGLTGFSRASPYNTDTCAADSETNGVQGLTTTGENIVSTTGPVASAHAEVIANAAISGTTEAHADYADTLTFIATANF